MAPDAPPVWAPFDRALGGLLVALAIAHCVFVAWTANLAYIDFGDGNYLYIASRMADGLMLYRDILAPQPPLHLFVGSLIIRFARIFGDDPATAVFWVRMASAAIHVYTMALLAALAMRLFACRVIAGLTALFYMIIPIGFWWTYCYQSEPLMLAALLTGLYALLHWTPRALAIAGLLHLLAALTNMTSAPYICWILLWLLIFDRRSVLWYIVPVIGGWLLVVGGFYLAGSDYLGNVFFNQVGTFPKEEILGKPLWYYVAYKVLGEGRDIWSHNFFFVVWGVVGLALWLRGGAAAFVHSDRPTTLAERNARLDRRWLLGTFIFWSYGSLGFVSKGATMEYIFTIGEPVLCLMAAGAVVVTWRRAGRALAIPTGRRLALGAALAMALALTAILQTLGLPPGPRRASVIEARVDSARERLRAEFWQKANWLRPTEDRNVYYWALREFGGQRNLMWRFVREISADTPPPGPRLIELTDAEVRAVVAITQAHSEPGERVLAPPHLAFAADRPIHEEWSEHFIWRIKWLNERLAATKLRAAGASPDEVEAAFADGTAKVRSIVAAISARELPALILNSQVRSMEPIREAVEAHYQLAPLPDGRPVREDGAQFMGANTPFWIFIPKHDTERHVPE